MALFFYNVGMTKISITDSKILQAKLEGKKQQDIAKEVFPNATPGSGAVMVSRRLKRANVGNALEKALRRNGITFDKVIKPIADALKAEKMDRVKNGEGNYEWLPSGLPDHTIRLKASGMARDLLGLEKQAPDGATVTSDDVKHLLNTSDEIELQRAIFSKTE